MNTLIRFVVSLGGVGYLPAAPATWGSAFAGAVLFLGFPQCSVIVRACLTIVVFCIGWLGVQQSIAGQKDHDPSYVVIDECVGMMITCLFLAQVWWHFLLAFLLFRFFDIGKFWPASYFDRQSTAFAVMFDDVLMALPSLLIMTLIQYMFS